jgi:N-hydroxyarylamine O-acetyltransferase
VNHLLEDILLRLGFSSQPELTLDGLRAVYGAWCRRVPFDNVRKLIHVRTADPRPLPGSTPEDFFEAWLRHGTGGTCWAGAGSCHALLRCLGFEAERGVATMLHAPDAPPNHGTVRVRLDGEYYLVDCSMLHGEPLRLDAVEETRIAHPAWGVVCAIRDGHWHVTWRALHRVDGFECRLERFGAEADEYQRRYERTREWSPFNYEVTARLNRGEEVTGLAFGEALTLHADGAVSRAQVTHEDRQRLLMERLGLSEEIVSQLPHDVPTPPPPGSQTARRLREAEDISQNVGQPPPG